jgi:ABC-type proline/glycine betaine transport system ATPase subunit
LGDILDAILKKGEIILRGRPKQTLVVFANEYFKVFNTDNRALILLKLEDFFGGM